VHSRNLIIDQIFQDFDDHKHISMQYPLSEASIDSLVFEKCHIEQLFSWSMSIFSFLLTTCPPRNLELCIFPSISTPTRIILLSINLELPELPVTTWNQQKFMESWSKPQNFVSHHLGIFRFSSTIHGFSVHINSLILCKTNEPAEACAKVSDPSILFRSSWKSWRCMFHLSPASKSSSTRLSLRFECKFESLLVFPDADRIVQSMRQLSCSSFR
jgi:hypothetical protein